MPLHNDEYGQQLMSMGQAAPSFDKSTVRKRKRTGPANGDVGLPELVELVTGHPTPELVRSGKEVCVSEDEVSKRLGLDNVTTRAVMAATARAAREKVMRENMPGQQRMAIGNELVSSEKTGGSPHSWGSGIAAAKWLVMECARVLWTEHGVGMTRRSEGVWVVNGAEGVPGDGSRLPVDVWMRIAILLLQERSFCTVFTLRAVCREAHRAVDSLRLTNTFHNTTSLDVENLFMTPPVCQAMCQIYPRLRTLHASIEADCFGTIATKLPALECLSLTVCPAVATSGLASLSLLQNLHTLALKPRDFTRITREYSYDTEFNTSSWKHWCERFGADPDNPCQFARNYTFATADWLLHVSTVQSLRHLDLSGECWDVRPLWGWGALREMTQLESLELRYLGLNGFHEGYNDASLFLGMRDLGLPKLHARLTKLDLTGNLLSDNDMSELQDLDNLTELILFRCGINDSGLEHISHLTSLETLDLQACNISDVGVSELLELARMTHLDFGRERDGDFEHIYRDEEEQVFIEGSTIIDTIRNMPGLQYLSLRGSAVPLQYAGHLLNTASLTHLDLSSLRVTASERDRRRVKEVKETFEALIPELKLII